MIPHRGPLLVHPTTTPSIRRKGNTSVPAMRCLRAGSLGIARGRLKCVWETPTGLGHNEGTNHFRVDHESVSA